MMRLLQRGCLLGPSRRGSGPEKTSVVAGFEKDLLSIEAKGKRLGAEVMMVWSSKTESKTRTE